MQTVKCKIALLQSNISKLDFLNTLDPVLLNPNNLYDCMIEVLVITLDDLVITEWINWIEQQITTNKILNLILITDNDSKEMTLTKNTFNRLSPDYILPKQEFNLNFLHSLWEDISQAEQDESYLNLSTELNMQYEEFKNELEKKLFEKKQNLVESQQQVIEINNRFELLRKTLYITSKVKNISEAESELNQLLCSQNKINSLKIISENESLLFEQKNLKSQKNTFFKKQILLNTDFLFNIYFLKNDSKPFKKSDLDFFKKIAETLQINLSRSENLKTLQQSERLFDLAFHSSPQYIIVIDDDYQVLQANLAVLEKQKDDQEETKSKCYEVLFNRTQPCAGCKRGDKFQIQDSFKTYKVQSNHFHLNTNDESTYWIHLYEDISEQISLENKFQQSARLAELGLISSSIAHELNNPLGGIISYLQMMKLELPQNHPFLVDIDMMYQTAQRMKKIIEDLLIFSRKESNLQLEQISLHEILIKNIDLLQLQLKKENLKVSVKTPETDYSYPLSILHFRNSIHLVFQYFIQKLKTKKLTQNNFTGLVEVKIFQDQINFYLSFSANLGPHDPLTKTNDMTLMTLEKSLLDQGFQVSISDTMPNWIQILITLPA